MTMRTPLGVTLGYLNEGGLGAALIGGDPASHGSLWNSARTSSELGNPDPDFETLAFPVLDCPVVGRYLLYRTVGTGTARCRHRWTRPSFSVNDCLSSKEPNCVINGALTPRQPIFQCTVESIESSCCRSICEIDPSDVEENR
jgi:hypothetical protein